jgi:hypothetical protein
MILWNVRNVSPNSSLTTKNAWIFSSTAVRTSNVTHYRQSIMWGMILWCAVDVATYTAALYSESCMKVSVVYNLSNVNFHTYIIICAFLNNKNNNNNYNSSVTKSLSNPWDCLYHSVSTQWLTVQLMFGHTLYHDACIITTNDLMMGLQGLKYVEDTLWN